MVLQLSSLTYSVAVAFVKLRKDEPNMIRPFQAGKSNMVVGLRLSQVFSLLYFTSQVCQQHSSGLMSGVFLLVGDGIPLDSFLMFVMREKLLLPPEMRYEIGDKKRKLKEIR